MKSVPNSPYFSVCGLNAEIYSGNRIIKSKYKKIWTQKNLQLGHILRSPNYWNQFFLHDFKHIFSDCFFPKKKTISKPSNIFEEYICKRVLRVKFLGEVIDIDKNTLSLILQNFDHHNSLERKILHSICWTHVLSFLNIVIINNYGVVCSPSSSLEELENSGFHPTKYPLIYNISFHGA